MRNHFRTAATIAALMITAPAMAVSDVTGMTTADIAIVKIGAAIAVLDGVARAVREGKP